MYDLRLKPMENHPAFIKINQAGIAEAVDMALIMERATAERASQPLPQQPSEEEVLCLERRMSIHNSWAFAAYLGGRMTGFVVGHPSIFESTVDQSFDKEYLALLMVDPEHWGSGVGTKLLNSANDHANKIGKKSIELWTVSNNHRAKSLYKNRGYRLVDKPQRQTRHGLSDLYRLDLS